MQQQMFPDLVSDIRVTTLTGMPCIAPELAARLQRLHIRVLSLTWNEWFHEWHFQLHGPFGMRAEGCRLTKTLTGVHALVSYLEQRR